MEFKCYNPRLKTLTSEKSSARLWLDLEPDEVPEVWKWIQESEETLYKVNIEPYVIGT